jgi:HK97 family phage major capsid protein
MNNLNRDPDLLELLEQQGESFQRLGEKLNRMDDELLELQKKANRPNIAGSSYRPGKIEESRKALSDYIKSRGEIKMDIGSGPDGGWTVIPALNETIGNIARNASVLRQLVNFVEVGSTDAYEELISVEPAAANWVGELESRPNTTAPKLAKITTNLFELCANPTITQRLIDDSSFNMVDFLVGECAISFAESEDIALFDGVGVKSPLGLNNIETAYTSDLAGTRRFGVIESLKTSANGTLNATDPLDAIKSTYYALKAQYRANATWVMPSAVALAVSVCQDSTGHYLWEESSVAAGTPALLLGRPVTICESVQAPAADSKSIWFGDWNTAIRGIERSGNKLLLDPYSSKPNVSVYVTKRVGFQLRNSNALKVLRFSA